MSAIEVTNTHENLSDQKHIGSLCKAFEIRDLLETRLLRRPKLILLNEPSTSLNMVAE